MCGVVGITAEYDISRLLIEAGKMLSNRGQTSAGGYFYDSSSSNDYKFKDVGKITDIVRDLKPDPANIGVIHTRYSTAGSNDEHKLKQNAQPEYKNKPFLVAAHNGNIYNHNEVMEKSLLKPRTECDIQSIVIPFTESLLKDRSITIESIERASKYTASLVKGSYSAVFLTETDDRKATLFSLTDSRKIRPLVLGKREKAGKNAWCIASETLCLDRIGFEYYKDVEAGMLTVVYPELDKPIEIPVGERKKPMHCMFEWVYFSNPESTICGKNVHDARVEIGRELARMYPVEADVVIDVPESGRLLAVGYAQQSGIHYDVGLRKFERGERSFIQQLQVQREESIQKNLIANANVVNDKRVIVTDDSLVRGTNIKNVIKTLKKAGAKEVHVRLGCPPVISGCCLGVDMKKGEFIATDSDDNLRPYDDIANEIGAASIGYVTEDFLKKTIIGSNDYDICSGCINFPNGYPPEMREDVLKFSKIKATENKRAYEN